MKVGEFIQQLEVVGRELDGKKLPAKEFAVAVEETMKNSGILTGLSLDCIGSNITIDVSIWKNTKIFNLKAVYRTHKTRWDGISDYIDHVEIANVFNLPMDTDMEDIKRVLQYMLAKERKSEIEPELDNLKRQIAIYEAAYAEIDKLIEESLIR